MERPGAGTEIMSAFMKMVGRVTAFGALAWFCTGLHAQSEVPKFKVVGFYTARNDQAHISFVKEANRWFHLLAATNNFAYEATTNWNQLNAKFLAQCQVVVFLDTRPDDPAQRKGFETYMEQGGAWMGFH